MKRKLGVLLVTAECAMVALIACSSSSSSPIGSPTSKTIGAAGGTITDAKGDSVQIPAGALPSDVTVTISPASNAPPPAGATVVGSAVTLGPEGQQFAVPVTVTLGFSSSQLPAPSSTVFMFTAPAGTSSYAALSGSSVSGSQVSAQTTHFSTFVPAVVTGAAAFDSGVSCQGGPCDQADATTATPDASVCSGAPVDCETEPPEGTPCCPITTAPCQSASPGSCDFECICTASGTHCAPCGTIDAGSPPDAGCSGATLDCMTEPPEGTPCCPVSTAPCKSASPGTCDF